MTQPYRYIPGSIPHRVMLALDAAAVPMTAVALREAVEYEGRPLSFHGVLQGAINAGAIVYKNQLYSRGKVPLEVFDRRVSAQRGPNAWRGDIQAHAAMMGTLRTLMDDGSASSTGDPLRALADAMDVARTVLAAGRNHKRYTGAEVELLVARELRSITIAAQLAVTTLNEALEVLK